MSPQPLVNRYRADLFACRLTARGDKFGAELKERDDGKIDLWPVTLADEHDLMDFAEQLKAAATQLAAHKRKK